MSGFPILDLVVGMIFIYFLLSIISSSAVEIIMTARKYRAKMLEKWLRGIFDKDVTLSNGKKVKLGQAIMDHCSVTALSKSGKATSYIDAKNFTAALIEKITYDHTNPLSIATDLNNLIASIKNSDSLPSDLKRVFLSYASEVKDSYKTVSLQTASELDLFKQKVETWFDMNMERVGGTLKTRYARPLIYVIAALVAIGLNADSVSIARYLYSNPDSRAKLAASAFTAADEQAIKDQVDKLRKAGTDAKDSVTITQLNNTIQTKVKELNAAKAALDEAIPLGWNTNDFKQKDTRAFVLFIVSKIFGLFFTFLAIVMGAPFWFDLLNKIANLRGAGTKPLSKANE